MAILFVLFLTAGSVYLRPAAEAAPRHVPVRFQAGPDEFTTHQSTTGYELAVTGSGLTILPQGSEIPWRHEFLNRNRRSTGIRHGEEVRYHEIFTGVDLRLYDKGIGRAGYDFIVRPGQSAARILMQLDGPGTAYLDELTEELVLPVTGGKQIRHTRPVAYQQLAGERLVVAAGFTLTPGGLLGFEVGDYNPDYALVIDPAIVLAEAANITDNNQADPIKLSRCFTPNELQVNIQFLAAGQTSISYIMPEGIAYVPGSVNVGFQRSPDGTVFTAVEEDVSDVRAPVFTLNEAVDVGDFVRLQLGLTADCDATAGSDDIEVSVITGDDESFGLAVATVLEADLSVLSHAPQTLMINELDEVEITIRNGGLGQLDSFLFLIDTTANSANTVSLTADNGNIVFEPTRVGSSVQFSITSAALMTIGNMDGVFDNTEAIVLTRTVLQEACRPTSQVINYTDFYRAVYGCPGSCQFPEPVGPGAFSVPNVFVSLTATGELIQQSDYCQPTIAEVTVTNTSLPTDQLRNAFNVGFVNTIGESISSYQVDNLDVTAIELVTDAGLVPLTFTGGNNSPASGSLSQLTSAQPGSGLADIDMDGQFDDLGLNQSFTLRYTYTYERDECNINDVRGRDFYRFPYSDDCGRGSLAVEYNASTFNYENEFIINSANAPATVVVGTPFTVTLCQTGGPTGTWLQTGQLATCPDRTTSITVDVPAGLMAEAGAGYTISADGSSLMAEQPFAASNPNCFSFDFTADCGQLPGALANYTVDIPYEFSNGCNVMGGCAPQIEACGEQRVRVNCVGGGGSCEFAPCATQPVLNGDVAVFRTTLGFRTGGFGNAQAPEQYTDISQIPEGNRTIGTACDSIAIVGSAQVCGGSSNVTDNMFLRIAVDRFASTPDDVVLEEGTRGRFTLTRADGSIPLDNVPLPTPQNVNVEGRDFIIYDLSPLLPNSELRGGDIIDFRTDHRLSLAVDAQSENLTPLSSFGISAFSLPNASDRVIPNSKAEVFACIERDLSFRVHAARVAQSQRGLAIRISGCAGTNFGAGIQVRAGGAEEDYYPDELRPFYVMDSLTVNLGRFYTGGRGSLRVGTRSPGYAVTYGLNFDPENLSMTPANPRDLPGKLITGAPNWTFRFYNTNRVYMALAEYRSRNSRNNSYQIRFPVANNCSNQGPGPNVFMNGQRYAHNTPDPGCTTAQASMNGRASIRRITTRLTNTSGTQVLDQREECYTVIINNTFRNQVNYVHIVSDYLNPANLSGLRISSVNNRATGASYEVLDYEEGQWAKIFETVPPNGNSTPLVVCVTAEDCSATDQLPLFVGFSCDSFPNSPIDRRTDPVSQCAAGRITLPVIPGDAAVQLDILSQPGTEDLCTPLVYTLRVNSSQVANILDPFITAQVPEGMMLQSAEVQYPFNTGTFEDVTSSVSVMDEGTNLELFLGAATSVNDSLLGTFSSTSPGGEDREAAIRLTFLSSCETPVGEVLRFGVGATQICGNPARGTGVTVRSTPISVDGTVPEFLPIIGDIVPGVTELTCENAVISAELDFLDRSAGDGQPSTIIAAKDSTILIIPASAAFVPGGYSCTGADCPTVGSIRILPDGRTRVALGYANDVTIPDAGDFAYTINYTVNGKGTDSECGDALIFEVQITNSVEDLPCMTEPAQICPNAVTVIAARKEIALDLKKPVITDLTAMATRTNVEDYTFNGTFTVTERPIPAGDVLVVDVYCVDAANMPIGAPVGSAMITGPVAVGETVAYSGTASGACSDQLYLEINPVTATGEPQCACAPVAIIAPALSVCSVSIVNILTPCVDEDTFTLAFDVDYDFFNATLTPVEVFVDGVSQGTRTPPAAGGPTGTLEYRDIVVAGPRFDGEIRVLFQSVDSCEISANYDLIACPAPCPNTADAIGGNVFSDGDFDGAAAGAGEGGVSNTRVMVYDCDGTLVCDTYTGADGNWSCDGLMPNDTFRVEFSNPLQDSLAPGFAGPAAGARTQFVVGGSCEANYAVIDSTTVDAADLNQVQIGNYIWEDTNEDGSQQSCEPPLANVPVSLYTPAGALVATTTTGPDGTYYFTGAGTPGETWPNGGTLQPATDYVVAFGTDGASTPTFLDEFLTVDGQVFSLTMADAGNNDLDSDATLNATNLPFSGLPTISVTTPSNGSDHSFDVGFVMESGVSIGSTVFIDYNNNGTQNAIDVGVPDVPVDLYAPGVDGIIGTGDDFAVSTGEVTTDANGDYLFTGIAPGNYYVQIPASAFNPGTLGQLDTFTRSSTPTDERDNQQDGDDNGTQTGGAASLINSPIINLKVGEEPAGPLAEGAQGGEQDDALMDSADEDGDMTIDFGLIAPVSLGDTVFVDLNEDGVQDPGEMGLAGATVTVFNANGTPVSVDIDGSAYTNETTSDATGAYTFENLAPGNYFVVFNTASTPNQDFYAFTAPNRGGDEANDSDANVRTGRSSDSGFLLAGSRNPDLDAGVVCQIEAFAGKGGEACGKKPIPIQSNARFEPAGLTATWTTEGDGQFATADGTVLGATAPAATAAFYIPGTGDQNAGFVTLDVTSEDPPGPCLMVTSTVTYKFNNVDCGTIPNRP